jgi:hypothetical protein
LEARVGIEQKTTANSEKMPDFRELLKLSLPPLFLIRVYQLMPVPVPAVAVRYLASSAHHNVFLEFRTRLRGVLPPSCHTAVLPHLRCSRAVSEVREKSFQLLFALQRGWHSAHGSHVTTQPKYIALFRGKGLVLAANNLGRRRIASRRSCVKTEGACTRGTTAVISRYARAM